MDAVSSNSTHPHSFFLPWCASCVISLILSASGWILCIEAGFPTLLLNLLRLKFGLCLLQVYAAWGVRVLVQKWLWTSRSTQDFALIQETEDIPWIWVEYRNNFDQLKAKLRNNCQSNATAAIPYTVICMWARWLILPEERQSERLQQSKAAEVCLEKHTAVWEMSVISWDQLFPPHLEINKPQTKLYELLTFCFMVLVLLCIQLLLTSYLLFIKCLL